MTESPRIVVKRSYFFESEKVQNRRMNESIVVVEMVSMSFPYPPDTVNLQNVDELDFLKTLVPFENNGLCQSLKHLTVVIYKEHHLMGQGDTRDCILII